MREQKIDITKIEDIINNYKGEKWALIPLLQQIQKKFGYIPKESIHPIASGLKLYPSEVQGVIEFYSGFSLVPKGRHVFKVCCGTACHVKGSRAILGKIKKELGINEGETSPDYQFTLETVACLGTCFLAPVMMANRDYYGKLTTGKIASVIARYDRKKEAVKES